MKRLLALVVVVLGVMAAGHSAAAPGGDDAVFDAMAKELIESLQKDADVRRKLLDTMASKFGMAKRRIAVWPFKKGDLPVPEGLTQTWDQALMGALVRNNPGTMTFVTRRYLATVIKELSSLDVTGEVENPVALVARNASADVLVIGSGLPAEEGIELSFQAVEVATGVVLATTRRHFLKVDYGAAGAHVRSLTLDAAVEEAAKALAEVGPAMKRMRLGGVRYADSGIQSSFGDYVSRHVADALQVAVSASQVGGEPLEVADAAMDPRALAGTRGIDLTAKEVETLVAAPAPGDYALTGTYWVFDRHVELRLALRNSAGQGVPWNARIHKASIANELALIPEQRPSFGKGGIDGAGPIGLELTSNKGRNPVFKIGEEMVLLARTTEGAHLYCFYKQVDGGTLKIFPNAYVAKSRITGQQQHHIPSPSMPFKLTISEPVGVEAVKCFALDREVGDRLPPDVASDEFRPLPKAVADDLTGVFRALTDVRISEATMMVTVRP